VKLLSVLFIALIFCFPAASQQTTDTQEKKIGPALAAILAKSANKYDENGNRKLDKFATVQEMISDFGDFYPENKSYELISESPLHIRLSPMAVKGDHVDVIQEELKRAMIYGIYRSFIHTDVNEITVTVYPVLTTFRPVSHTPLPDMAVTISKTRQQALRDAQKFVSVKSFAELLGGKDLTWTKQFNQLRFNDQGGVGLDNFYSYMVRSSDEPDGTQANILIESSGLEWQRSSYLLKLAVCETAITALYEHGSFRPEIMVKAASEDGIHRLSRELVIELDKAFRPYTNKAINQSKYENELVIHKIAAIFKNGWVKI
jgi:hypothetical protein